MVDLKQIMWWEWLLLVWLSFDIIMVIYTALSPNGTAESMGRYTGSILYKWVIIGIGYYLFVYRNRTKNILEGR